LNYIRLLENFGHELRRPHADFLRDGIYELRPTSQNVNYRILYAFVGKQAAIVSHWLDEVGQRTRPGNRAGNSARQTVSGQTFGLRSDL
jgi:hypothetical protein